MANSCYNYITISGSADEIAKFKIHLIENGKTDLYQQLMNEFGRSGDDARWFDMEVYSFDDFEITISGDSAWIPCLDLFTTISERYKSFNIRYEYEESGCDFAGYADISEGYCSDNQYNYWEGVIINQGEYEVLDLVLANELGDYDTKEEVINSPFYKHFSAHNQKIILKEFNDEDKVS